MAAVFAVSSSVDADPNIGSREGSSHYGLGVTVRHLTIVNHAYVLYQYVA